MRCGRNGADLARKAFFLDSAALMHSGRSKSGKASQRWVAVAQENALQVDHAHKHGTTRIERQVLEPPARI